MEWGFGVGDMHVLRCAIGVQCSSLWVGVDRFGSEHGSVGFRRTVWAKW